MEQNSGDMYDVEQAGALGEEAKAEHFKQTLSGKTRSQLNAEANPGQTSRANYSAKQVGAMGPNAKAEHFTQTLSGGQSDEEEASEIIEMVRLAIQSNLVGQGHRVAIDTSVQLYRAGEYSASFKNIYPSIEAILNTMLSNAGISQPLSGLVSKAKHLHDRGIIFLDVKEEIEVFAKIRNPVAHGNISLPEEDAHVFCTLAFLIIRRLLRLSHP